MKKRLSYFQLSKTVMFALILFMVGLYVWGAGKITVCAADYTSLDTTTNENFVVAAYTADVAKKYVGTKAPTVENYLFAGWFKDAKCSEEQVIISATEIVDGITCYAKFVPEDVLSIKVQISEGDANSSTADVEKNIRFVSSVDTVTYTSIGFRMKYQDDNQNWVYKISRGTLVYKRIETATKGDEYRFSPKVVDTKSEYFMTSVWKGENNAGIAQEDYDTNYYVRAYWVTFDGIRVYGPTRYVSVNDGLNSNIVNTSIKDTKQTLSGKTLSASYTNSTGKEATASSVELYHDGTYAHLKIDLGTSVNRTTALLSATKFTVTGGTATADAIYRNLYTTQPQMRILLRIQFIMRQTVRKRNMSLQQVRTCMDLQNLVDIMQVTTSHLRVRPYISVATLLLTTELQKKLKQTAMHTNGMQLVSLLEQWMARIM